MVKHLPAMQETRVRSLGREDPLEKEKTTHSSILAWKIPWSEEPDRLQSMGSQRVGHDRVHIHLFLVARTVKNLPAMWETQVPSLGQEDPLEKEMATHSNTLAWKILWIEEPGGLQSVGLQKVGHD